MSNLLILLAVIIVMIVGFIKFGVLNTVFIAASGAGAYYVFKKFMYNKKPAAGMGGMGGFY